MLYRCSYTWCAKVNHVIGRVRSIYRNNAGRQVVHAFARRALREYMLKKKRPTVRIWSFKLTNTNWHGIFWFQSHRYDLFLTSSLIMASEDFYQVRRLWIAQRVALLTII
jgi:hypothetical protein